MQPSATKTPLKPLLFSVSLLLLLGASLVLAACLTTRSARHGDAQGDAVHTESAATGVPPRAGWQEAAGAASAAEVRQAVARALPYMEEHGVAWMDNMKCVSCHQIPAMLWSFNEAAAHGVPVDRTKLEAWNRWSVDKSMEAAVNNFDGFHQMILGRVLGTDEGAQDYRVLADFIARAQEPDGSWKAGGQLPLQRRPEDESHRVSSLWSLLALASLDGEAETLTRGREHIENCLAESGQSHEWLIVRLLYEKRFGSRDGVQEILREIFREQNPDGGWAWIRGEASDAFATGQTLYALQRLGWPMGEPAVERARAFLLETQREDGSWLVQSTLKREHGPSPTSNFWGTGWAIVGLLRSLPEDGDRVAAASYPG